ncbi:MAG: glycoside hydrolase family 76 protein [Acidobacteriaceae bacterium]
MGWKAISILLVFSMSAAISYAAVNSAAYTKSAARGIAKLQSWYSPNTGAWASPAGWWNGANSLTVLANYEQTANDDLYYSVISTTFRNAPKSQKHPDFINNYYDDSGWWALAWIAAYDTTGNASYLFQAETIFKFLTGGWDNVCGGGLYWTTAKNGKNAIPNELFLDVAAKLANRTAGSTSASYLAWARKEWTWFKDSGLINSSSLINDGLNSSCANNGATEWTYNQGVILGGLVELYQADHDSTLLPQAEAIANSVLAHLTNSNGVLVESRISGGDAPQFKGIFMRNLMALYAVAPNSSYRRFIDTNVNSILANDRSTDYEFGAIWQGPFDSADPTRQTSALDALIAGMAVQNGAPR